MEIRLFILAICVLVVSADDITPNRPVITSAKTKVARANVFGEVPPSKKTPKPDVLTTTEVTSTTTFTTSDATTTTTTTEDGKKTGEPETSTESIWTALGSLLETPSVLPGSTSASASGFMKLLQTLSDVTETTKKEDGLEVEHHGRFARGVKEDDEYFLDDDEDDEGLATPLTPSLEDALARLANHPDDQVVSFESDTIPSTPTPPPTAPAWARVPLYYQGAGLQLSREPSPPALVNPSLTSVPSNAMDLSALLAMMLRAYPTNPSPVQGNLLPNLLFPSMSLVNRSSNSIVPPANSLPTSVNTLFGKSYNPPKFSPDLKFDDKDGSSKELDPAESTQDKVSAKKPDENDYEYEYVYYYYDEDDPNNKTMVVKPASAVKPKTDQKTNNVPALLPRQPVGPSAAEGRSVEGGNAENALKDPSLTRTPSPLLTPLFTTPSVVKPPPMPFVQGPQSPVMFLGIQRESFQGPRVPGRTHPSREPDDLYAFSRAFEDQTQRLTSLEPFTYRPNTDVEADEELVGSKGFVNTSDEELLVPKVKLTTAKPTKKTTTVSTTTEKATTSGKGGRRPGSGRKPGRTTSTTTQASTTSKGKRLPNRNQRNQRKNNKGKETTEKPEDENEEVEKTTRGNGRRKPTRTRTTTPKPNGGEKRGGRRRTTTPRSTTKRTTTAASDDTATQASAGAATTAKRGLSNLFPRRKNGRQFTTTPAAADEEEVVAEVEEETVQSTSTEKPSTSGKKAATTVKPLPTVSEVVEEEEEVEQEEVQTTPVAKVHRLRPLRPLLRVTTTLEPENS